MEKCIFMGYPDGYKGWKFYNPITKKVIISERADFDEWYTYGTISESGDIRESNTTRVTGFGLLYIYYTSHDLSTNRIWARDKKIRDKR